MLLARFATLGHMSDDRMPKPPTEQTLELLAAASGAFVPGHRGHGSGSPAASLRHTPPE